MSIPALSTSTMLTTQSNPLSKKISKILETKIDQNRDLLEPLKGKMKEHKN